MDLSAEIIRGPRAKEVLHSLVLSGQLSRKKTEEPLKLFPFASYWTSAKGARVFQNRIKSREKNSTSEEKSQ
jgi:hypothetical protein